MSPSAQELDAGRGDILLKLESSKGIIELRGYEVLEMSERGCLARLITPWGPSDLVHSFKRDADLWQSIVRLKNRTDIHRLNLTGPSHETPHEHP